MSEHRPDNNSARRLPQPDDWIADRFKVVRVIGKGGFGTVYEAHQESMGDRRVALKILAPKRQTEHNAVERFRQEALLASRLHHPNTITLFDFGATPDGLLYIAMEFLEGEPVGTVVKRSGPLNPRRAEHIVRQVLGALSEAHAIGLIHRDLKPDNVFLTRIYGEPDFVKVLDFGLAKMSDVLDERVAGITDLPRGGRTDLTMEGLVCGTPDYMAPEQAQGIGPLTPAVDVYAVGLLIYQMLSGRKPFQGKEPMEVLKQQVHAQLAPLPAHVSEHRLAKLMRVATRKRATERYPDASAMLQALSGQAAMDPTARPARPKLDDSSLTKTRAHGMSALPRPTPRQTVELDDDYVLGLDLDVATSPGLAIADIQPPTLVPPEDDESVDQPTTGHMHPVSSPQVDNPTPQNNEHITASHTPHESPTRPGRRNTPLPGLLTGQIPLLGREQEVRQILGVVRSTADEGDNRLLLIEGDAGVGKSRLLTEIGRIVRETSDILVAGGFFRDPGASPDEALASLTGHIFSITPERAADLARMGMLDKAIQQNLERTGMPLTERDISLIASMLVPKANQNRHPALVLERMVRLMIRMASQQPLFLVFEDLQFADPASLDFLRRLASSVARHAKAGPVSATPPSAICLTVTLRRQSTPHREDVARMLRFLEELSEDIAPTIHIEGLSEAASLQLVDALLPADVELRRRVADAAHGNPLHMVQILHHLYHTHRLIEVAGSWKLRDDSVPLSLPEDLMEMVRLRVKHAIIQSSAPEAMQELLYRLAVLGRRVPRALLRTILALEERPWPEDLTERMLDELQGHHLIIVDQEQREVQDDDLPIGEHIEAMPIHIHFENGMLPELLQREVDSSLAGTRLHHTAARAKQAFYGESSAAHADELASHLIRAGMPSKALPHLIEAGHQRQRLGDLLGARSHYLNAENLLASFNDEIPSDVSDLAPTLWLAMGQVHLRLGRYTPAEYDLRRALSLAEQRHDARTMGRASLHLGELHLVQKHHSASSEQLGRAKTWAERAGDRATILNVVIRLGELKMAESGTPSSDDAVDFEHTLETLAEDLPLLRARGLQHLGAIALAQGDNHSAERYLARARLIADEVGDPGLQAPICSDLGHVLLLQGRAAEGEGLLRQAHQIYRELGDQLALSTCLHRLALAAWHRRDLGEAMDLIGEALEIQRQLRAIGHMSESISLLGRVQEARGEFQHARKAYLEVLDLPLNHSQELTGDLLLRLGATDLKLGRLNEARQRLEQAGQRFATINNLSKQVQSLNLMAMAASWRREPMQATALLERSEELARRCDDHPGRVFALAALCLISFASPLGDSTTPGQRLEQARQIHHLHQSKPSPLLQTVAGILDGHGASAVSPELPMLQRRWLEQLIGA